MKRKQAIERSPVANVWLAFGGLLALGLAVLVFTELPAVRREIHLMRM
jgi:hypothetical protein